MGLKEILTEARNKIATEEANAIATAKATILASEVQPKLIELENAKSSAIKERTDAINAQISALKVQLSEEITSITKQCDESKANYSDKIVEERLATVKAKYDIELAKLDTQIAAISE